MYKEQLENLQLNMPTVIKKGKPTLERICKTLEGNYVIAKLKHNECVVTLVEGIMSVKDEVFELLDFSGPFERVEYAGTSVEYLRGIVTNYNKKNKRAFKVTARNGVIEMYEPFEEIIKIDPMQADTWRKAFERELNKKL